MNFTFLWKRKQGCRINLDKCVRNMTRLLRFLTITNLTRTTTCSCECQLSKYCETSTMSRNRYAWFHSIGFCWCRVILFRGTPGRGRERGDQICHLHCFLPLFCIKVFVPQNWLYVESKFPPNLSAQSLFFALRERHSTSSWRDLSSLTRICQRKQEEGEASLTTLIANTEVLQESEAFDTSTFLCAESCMSPYPICQNEDEDDPSASRLTHTHTHT